MRQAEASNPYGPSFPKVEKDSVTLENSLIRGRWRRGREIRVKKKEKRWMKVKEVADYLSISQGNVYRLLYAHKLPGMKLEGVGWRIDRIKLDNWIEGEMEDREERWMKIFDY